MTVAVGIDGVALYAQIRLTRDKKDLAHARWLRDLAPPVVQALEAEGDLPEGVAAAGSDGDKAEPVCIGPDDGGLKDASAKADL